MGRETLLPAKTLYPPSMMRPEEVAKIITFSSKQKVTFTQVLTNQWEELEHSLDESETSKTTIARIESISRCIRERAKLPEPEVKAKLQQGQNTQLTRTSRPDSGNYEMTNGKRARRAEPDVKSATSQSSTKRAKTSDTNTSDQTFLKVERACTYNHVLVVWSQPMTLRQQCFLVKQMEEMKQRLMSAKGLDTAEAVTRHLPSIKNPLDLTTMGTFLEADRYSSVTDFCNSFKRMITDVHLQYGQDDSKSILARKLFRSFCVRMRHCPTGPDGKSVHELGKEAVQLMGLQITNATTKVTVPSSKEIEVIDIASDTDEPERTKIRFDTGRFTNTFSHHDDWESEDDDSDAEVEIQLLTQNKPVPETMTVRTPEPDDLDDETRQLQKEIEERQQKLANMAEKKKLLAEIRDLDTEKAELNGKIPELEAQLKQINSKAQNCRDKINTSYVDEDRIFNAIAWNDSQCVSFQRESERLLQESERCRQQSEVYRQEKERLRSVATENRQRSSALLAEEQQAKERSRQILQDEGQLKERRDRLEDQRAIAKKKLDALSKGNA